jgi:hypothetical protein
MKAEAGLCQNSKEEYFLSLGDVTTEFMLAHLVSPENK